MSHVVGRRHSRIVGLTLNNSWDTVPAKGLSFKLREESPYHYLYLKEVHEKSRSMPLLCPIKHSILLESVIGTTIPT